jgi:hypothetical protein
MRRAACILALLGGVTFAQQPAPQQGTGRASAPPPATITRQQLEDRLVELKRGRDQAMANVNAFLGSIQEVEHWLAELAAADRASEHVHKSAGDPPAASRKVN